MICKKKLFGEIVFDDDFHKIKTLHGHINDNYDFNNAKMFSLPVTYNIIFSLPVTCNTITF